MSYSMPDKLMRFGEDIGLESLRYHDRRVSVSKQFTFDAAHHLYLYDGKCNSLHGHTYKLHVTVSGTLDELGLVIDFADLRRVVEREVVQRLDHRYLNAVLPPMNTTAENMVVWIYERLAPALAREFPRVRVEHLTLWETPTSAASVDRSEMER